MDSPRESPWGTTQRDQKQGLEFGQEEYDEIDNVAAGESSDNGDLSNAMAAYAAAISKTKDIKLSNK